MDSAEIDSGLPTSEIPAPGLVVEPMEIELPPMNVEPIDIDVPGHQDLIDPIPVEVRIARPASARQDADENQAIDPPPVVQPAARPRQR